MGGDTDRVGVPSVPRKGSAEKLKKLEKASRLTEKAGVPISQFFRMEGRRGKSAK